MSSRFKKWEEFEDDVLKNNYSKIGPSGCSELIDRTIRACQLRAKKLKIKYDVVKDYYKYDNLSEIISISFSYSDCLRKMGLSTRPGNYHTLKKYIEKYDIKTDHFYKDREGGIKSYVASKKIDIEYILVEKSKYSTTKLKERLYKEKIKEKECELCGQNEEWMGKKISLILDHINGINDDNRIDNLRIVCPNCNATLDTHCRGNKRSNEKNKNYCECGKEIFKDSKKCVICNSINSRKVVRPDYQELVENVENFGYKSTGLKYGVSDNTIKKWIRFYEKIES